MTTVLIVYDRPDAFRQYLEERFPDLNFCYVNDPDRVEEGLNQHRPEVVFSIKHIGMPKEVHRPLVNYPGVKWVQVGGSGYDHLPPWDPSRTTVTNSAGVLARFLAETVTGAMIALAGRFPTYWEQQRNRVWQTNPFRPLVGQTLLVVGVGRIGEWVARNAKALGMHVIGIRASSAPAPVDELYTPDRLPYVIGRADFVSLHLRLNSNTENLIDRSMLHTMKAGAYLLNTSRGQLVDEEALIDLLRSGHLAGAYLDVFQTEPLPYAHPFWEMPNVMLTPHSSDSVENWDRRFAEFFAENLDRYLAGKPLRNVVMPPSL